MNKLFNDVELLKGSIPSAGVVGLYFSAHWCPPCRGFTPKLAETYTKIKEAGDKPFEIVFISSDKDQEQFDSYFAEMPWLALPFEQRDLKAKLSKKFKVNGIPCPPRRQDWRRHISGWARGFVKGSDRREVSLGPA